MSCGPSARLSLPLALGLGVLLSACGGSSGPVDGSRAYAHVERLVQLGPRPFGSDALAKAADYLTGELQALGLEAKRHEVLHEGEKKTIRNLFVQIDGEDPQNGPILMLGAHYDTKLMEGHADAAHNFRFVGAIDGGGGPAVLLELARVLKDPARRPKSNVWLYFVDAEESLDFVWNDNRALLGSKAFVGWLHQTKVLPRVKAFVLLDLVGSKDGKVDRDGNSDKRLQDVFQRAAKALEESPRVYEFPTQQELAFYAQKGIKWGTIDDHMTFTNNGVPSVLLIDFARRIPPHLQTLQPGQQAQQDDRFRQWWHTPDDDLAEVDPDTLALYGNLVVQALPELDAFCLGRK